MVKREAGGQHGTAGVAGTEEKYVTAFTLFRGVGGGKTALLSRKKPNENLHALFG